MEIQIQNNQIKKNIIINNNTSWVEKLKYISKYIEKYELKYKSKKSKKFVIEI